MSLFNRMVMSEFVLETRNCSPVWVREKLDRCLAESHQERVIKLALHESNWFIDFLFNKMQVTDNWSKCEAYNDKIDEYE